MNTESEIVPADIALAASGIIGRSPVKALLYAEVEEGAISADVFYLTDAGTLLYKFSTVSLRAAILSFWRKWKEQSGNREWRAMEYVIEREGHKLSLCYPEQLNASEGVPQRRPAVLKKHFGEAEVDYSNP